MKSFEFKPVKTVTVNGKTGMLRKYMHGDYFSFLGCKIPATSVKDAVDKLEACAKKREAKTI